MLNERSLLSQFLHFVAATVASLMVFSLYSIVDGLMVSKGVNEYAMASVNLAVPFTNVLFSIGVIFAVGTSTIIAIYLGQNQGEKANSLSGAVRRTAGRKGRNVSIYHRLSPGPGPFRAVLHHLL